jgi:voltage-gated potassium channel
MNPRAERMQQRLEWPMLGVALLVIPAIVIEQSSLGDPWDTVAAVINWITWLAFLAEALTMLYLVDNRWQWIRSHPLEVAIVTLTPPFLPASLQAARIFRLLRLLPLLRAGILARHLLTSEGVRDAAVFALLTVLAGGAAYAAVENAEGGEHLSTWDGVWWALTTVTTVGYGDSYPHTEVGRLIAVCVMLTGIGLVAIVTAAAAERFMRGKEAEAQRAEIHARLDEIIARLDSIENKSR